jgi:hypothetical protein
MKNPNTMLAFVFDDPFRADEARAALLRMAGEGMRKIDETAVLFRRSEEDTRVTQDAFPESPRRRRRSELMPYSRRRRRRT